MRFSSLDKGGCKSFVNVRLPGNNKSVQCNGHFRRKTTWRDEDEQYFSEIIININQKIFLQQNFLGNFLEFHRRWATWNRFLCYWERIVQDKSTLITWKIIFKIENINHRIVLINQNMILQVSRNKLKSYEFLSQEI